MKLFADKQRLKLYFWMALVFMLMWLSHNTGKYPGHFFALLLNNVWRVSYLVVLGFLFFEYSVPYVLQKRKYTIYNVLIGLVVLWVYVMFWSFGMYAWRQLGISLHVYTSLTSFSSTEAALQSQMSYSVSSVFFFGIVRHFYNYVKLKQATQLLRIEKQEAELNYLKSQTNPHFLFNTLNNIYSLAREKSDLAPESILRLSKILRYMLYEAGGEYIAIEQELKIISDYIELEKLRYDKSLRINFNYDVEDMKQAIPSLLLVPLVENAFKHGVSETRHRPFVDVHLSVRQRQLSFVVKNSSEALPEESGIKENIGLSNLRRQLELLYKDFNLSVQQSDGIFSATLKINLSSHV